MKKKFNDAPIPEEKKKLVEFIINHEVIATYHQAWANLRTHYGQQTPKEVKERNEAFDRYCEVRDRLGGLPKLNIVPMQGTQNRFK